jgi:hypothetical protein
MEERIMSGGEMQEIILTDALDLIRTWQKHPYDEEPSVEYYDILLHLRSLMKKLNMHKEEAIVSNAYRVNILNKKPSDSQKASGTTLLEINNTYNYSNNRGGE